MGYLKIFNLGELRKLKITAWITADCLIKSGKVYDNKWKDGKPETVLGEKYLSVGLLQVKKAEDSMKKKLFCPNLSLSKNLDVIFCEYLLLNVF